MGFVLGKGGGGGQEDPGGGSEDGGSLELDLDLKACVVCRRELLPWQERCPDDGGEAVAKSELPATTDPLAERLAAQLDDPDDDPDDVRG